MSDVLNIYRAGQVIEALQIDEDTKVTLAMMSDQYVLCSVKVSRSLNLQYEDYILQDGEVYKINSIPKKDFDGVNYSYQIKFDSQAESLKHEFMKFEGADEFPLYATADRHIALLVESLNVDDPGYTVGIVDVSEPVLIEYAGDTHLSALTKIAQKCSFEYYLKGKELNLVKTMGRDTGLTFEVGEQKGLYKLTLEGSDNSEVITRAYGYGGTRNIDYTYRNGSKKLVFEERFLESNVDRFKVRAGKYENADIFPKRTSSITAVTTTVNAHSVVDTTIDFNLAEHYQEGVTAKIMFTSGALMNQEFDIKSYDHVTKTIFFLESKDSDGYVLPNANSVPEVGDTYVLLDFRMPASYVTANEALLKAKTLEFLMQNNLPKVLYTLEIDQKYIRDNGLILKIGDKVNVVNPDNNLIHDSLRITGLTYPRVNPGDVVAVISTFVPYNLQERLVANAIESTKQFSAISKMNVAAARRATFVLRVLENSIFDTDGLFDSTKINVGVITAALGIFGIKSQNLLLNEVVVTDNFLNNSNSINITGGQLIHLEIEIAGLGSIWNMQGVTKSDLLSNTLYYIYARCSKIALVGEFIITPDQVKLEDVPGQYSFLLGVVSPAKNGVRDVAMTYGITSISGRRIKTGIIEGYQSSWNLDTGEIFGKLTFKGSGGVVKDVADTDNQAALANANALAAQITADTGLNQSNDALAGVVAANEFAEAIAKSEANIAKASAISAAQTDAESRATSAYNSAVEASNAYAVIKANAASTEAQLAAAADASNKAAQAYQDAVANAKLIYDNLTAALKPLAYQEFVLFSQLGDTIIDKGMIRTTLLNAAGIWANIINAGYITAAQIEALNISVTNLKAVNGNIGGWLITSDGLLSPNSFEYPGAGVVAPMAFKSSDASISLNNVFNSGSYWNPVTQSWEGIPLTRLVGSKIDPKGLYIASDGRYRGVDGVQAVMHIEALGNATHAAYLSAPASGTALEVNGMTKLKELQVTGALSVTGGIKVNGMTPMTGYEYISSGNPETRKYVNGIYMGQGVGMSW